MRHSFFAWKHLVEWMRAKLASLCMYQISSIESCLIKLSRWKEIMNMNYGDCVQKNNQLLFGFLEYWQQRKRNRWMHTQSMTIHWSFILICRKSSVSVSMLWDAIQKFFRSNEKFLIPQAINFLVDFCFIRHIRYYSFLEFPFIFLKLVLCISCAIHSIYISFIFWSRAFKFWDSMNKLEMNVRPDNILFLLYNV